MDDFEDFEFAVAHRFKNVFSSKRPTKLATPRELVDYVSVQTEPIADQRSLKQHAFYFIRGVIATELGVERGQLLPGTMLASLMPDRDQRRHHWKRIRRELGITWLPRLSRPSAVQWAIAITVAVLSYGVMLLAAIALEGSQVSLIIGAMSAGGFCALIFPLTEQFATEFLPASLTVGDLAAYATAYASKNRGLSINPSSRSQNLEIVRDLIRLEIGATAVNLDATWEELQTSVGRS